MEQIAATCPICHATRDYGAELVGRYTFCQGCRARFYVEVPTLAKSQEQQPFAVENFNVTAKKDMTLDDLLWDTQQGSRYLMDSLRTQDARSRTTRGLIVVALVLGLANLAGTTILLLR